MKYVSENIGTCSTKTELEIENGIILSCKIYNGCSGNTQGVCALLAGMKVDDAIERLHGIRCGFKPTSCPDQVAKGLIIARNSYLNENK